MRYAAKDGPFWNQSQESQHKISTMLRRGQIWLRARTLETEAEAEAETEIGTETEAKLN